MKLNIKSIQKIRNYFNSRLSISSNYLNEDSSIVSRERLYFLSFFYRELFTLNYNDVSFHIRGNRYFFLND